MFKHYFEQIDGIEIYPLFSLFLFVAFFALMLLWVLKVNKSYIKHMEELPLEKDGNGSAGENTDDNIQGDGLDLHSNL